MWKKFHGAYRKSRGFNKLSFPAFGEGGVDDDDVLFAAEEEAVDGGLEGERGVAKGGVEPEAGGGVGFEAEEGGVVGRGEEEEVGEGGGGFFERDVVRHEDGEDGVAVEGRFGVKLEEVGLGASMGWPLLSYG